MAYPIYNYFKNHKETEITEDKLSSYFKLAGNEARYCISKIVHQIGVPNLINLRDKVYILTTKKSLLKAWWQRKDKIQKPKYIQMAKVKKMIGKVA